jgi:alpha-1,2-mannosyltransferase
MVKDSHEQKWQRLFGALLAVIFIAVSIQYSIKVLKPREDGYTQGALARWMKQLQDLDDGENIHEKYNYPNPPIMAQILWPLTKLYEVHERYGPLLASLFWFYLKVGMALLCILWGFRLVETTDQPFPFWAKVLAVALSIRPIIGDLSHGNINIFILFLVMGSLYSFSRGRDLQAGIILALAIACKVTPALLVVYFLWKRSYRVVVGCGLGLVLFFLLLPAGIFALQEGSLREGWDRNWAALTSWVDGMIVPYLVHGVVTSERENQSLPGILTRLLTRTPSFTDFVDNIYVPLAYHNIADLSAPTVKRIVQVCQVLFLLLMVWLCRAPVQREGEAKATVRQGWRLAAEYSLILVAMLLFSERTWKHHCVTLLLPFTVLSYALFRFDWPKMLRAFVGLCLLLTALLMLSTSSIKKEKIVKAGEQLAAMPLAVGSTAFVGGVESDLTTHLKMYPGTSGRIAQVYGAYGWAFLALIAGLSALLIGQRPTRASASPLISGSP